ncbi:hypothetical protein BGW37DRAFT_497097 [Umbelopsis sp. PMI_123]|nr:hypothetical protein BGW37DRAFT_497097 [Umbelopsis sp. PMI_123]
MPSRNREEVTASIDIDPSFTGILYGLADDESDGCIVKGACKLHIVKPCKIRRLFVSLDGKLRVNLKSTVSMTPASDGVETRTLISKHKHYHGEDDQMEVLQPGDHVYPFEFELPSTLPATFHSKHGHITYRIRLSIHRPMFSTDITAKKEIILRRCLMDGFAPISTASEAVEGVFEQLMHYHASAPGMTYREGGLVKLNLNFDLLNPYTSSIREVSCALQETIQYRTTGVQAVNAHSASKLDIQFPLGCSTFYPSKAQDYDSSETHDYNAVFRVWPRVNADTNTKLLKVTHKLVINVSVEDRSNKEIYSETKPRSKSAPTTPACSDNEEEDDDDIVQSSSSSIRSTSSTTSTSSIALPLNLPRPKPFRSRSTVHINTYPMRTCKLELPLIVTSREHVWEGEMPTPPAYETEECPPSYFNTVVALPPVPEYTVQQTDPEAATASAY